MICDFVCTAMNLFKRGMVFVTFFGCCLAICLLAASLATQFWVLADANRSGNEQSEGKVNIGLFSGTKKLNVGYGWREYDMDITHLMYMKRVYKVGFLSQTYMVHGLWIATMTSVCVGMLFALFGAIFSVVNTAITPIEAVTGIPGLYLWNILAFMGDTVAMVTWVVQFHLRLTNNVLEEEDLEMEWTSKGKATIGYSFWFVVGAMVVHFLNILVIYIGTTEKREKQKSSPIIMEEKQNGAIMLY